MKKIVKFQPYFIVVVLMSGILLSCKTDSIKPLSIGLNIGSEEIVYTHATLVNKGLGYWADSPIGLLANSSGGLDFYTSNGGSGIRSSSKTTGSLTDPAKTVIYSNKGIDSIPSGIFGYSAITFVYKDPSTSAIIGLVHLERFPIGGASKFWASVGIAVSKDGGSTWNWCGEIIQHNISYNPNEITRGFEIGPGGYALVNPPDDPDNTYFYIYTYDALNSDGTQGTAVSLAKVADVVSAAINNTMMPAFHKYYQSGWTPSALGGLFSNISDDVFTAPDYISYNTELNQYILASRDYSAGSGIGQVTLRTSGNPIDFKASNGTVKYKIKSPVHHNVYGSIIGLGSEPQTTSGATFYLYYLAWPTSDNPWNSGTYMARRTILVKK